MKRNHQMERSYIVTTDFFDNPNFKTQYNLFEEIKDINNLEIYNLRKIKENNSLYNKDYNLTIQEEYYKNIYVKNRLLKKEIYYKISPIINHKDTYGFVRITNLDEKNSFNWHSLITEKSSPPWFAIDIILAVYNLCFNFLGKEYCKKWPVPKKSVQVKNLHIKMGIADLIDENDDFFFFDIQKKNFISKFKLFSKMKIGNIII